MAAPCRLVIDMLLQLGFYYKEVEAFVKAERFSASRKVKSQYRCALANGLQGKTLVEINLQRAMPIRKDFWGTNTSPVKGRGLRKAQAVSASMATYKAI